MTDQTPKKRLRPTTLVVVLGDLKVPWDAWCRTHEITPSEAVRRILRRVLESTPDNVAPRPVECASGASDASRRLELRMTAGEHLAIKAFADREGASVPRWLMGLVRLHITGEAPLARDEIETLARSNQLLLALSRNINQIAYNMHTRTEKDELTLAQIQFVSDFVKGHTQSVAKVLHANSKRWRR